MRIATSLFALGLLGCPGKAPPDQTSPDAAVDAGASPTASMVSGKAMDYFGNVALPDATVGTDGVDPPQMATSAMDGAYQLEIPVGSRLYLVASKTAYRPTRNESISVAEMPVTQDVYVMSVRDVSNQYTSVGQSPVAGTAFLVGDLRRNNNMPLDGVPLADVKLLDNADQPVIGIKGPYVFNTAGNISQTPIVTETHNGKSRIAFLDVPPGTHKLVVTYQGGNGPQTNTTMVTAAADGAVLALSGGMGGGGGGGMPPGGGGMVTDPSFAMHIHPMLQRAAQNGLGCANCHTAGGPAAILPFDGPAADVLAAILARPGVINAITPADSLLLKKPLYEPPPALQDHPNATFLDVNDPDYKLILLWIQLGTKP